MYLSRKLSSGYKTLFFDVSIGGGPSDPGSLFFMREDKDKPQNAKMIGEICKNITGAGLTCTLIILENKASGKGSPSRLICFLLNFLGDIWEPMSGDSFSSIFARKNEVQAIIVQQNVCERLRQIYLR